MELCNYKVLSVIGSGSFGTCYKVQQKTTGEEFAWKAIDYGDLAEAMVDSLASEISLMRQLRHPNIVQYFGHIVHRETSTVYIVMECCDGGDLAQLISRCRLTRCRLEEEFIWRVLFQTCRAVQACHSKIPDGTVLHRDIKPANIFLDGNGNAKLGDFGLARFLRRSESFADTFVGTPYYMSPEIIRSRKYDRKSDVWSVGCLTYEMCALRPPFRGSHFDQLSENISGGKFSDIPEYYSSDLQEIICFMLNVNRDSRPSVEVVLRNPVLVRNVPQMSPKTPILVPVPTAEVGFCQKLEFSPKKDFSSTTVSKFLVSTHAESPPTQKSNLYETILDSQADHTYCNSDYQKHQLTEFKQKQTVDDPNVITQNIFNQALQSRLMAVRAEESRLRQRESELDAREKELNERGRRLAALDKALSQKKLRLDALAKRIGTRRTKSSSNTGKNLDGTYCSIEPNETVLKPTVAKMDLAGMPPPKSFSKTVSFKSPQKFTKYNIENIPPKTEGATNFGAQKINLLSSTSSKASDDSEGSQKRKSLLSIFGLINQRTKSKSAKEALPEKNTRDEEPPPVAVINAVEPSNLAQIWTSQHKKAAFNMLAIMTAAEKEGQEAKPRSGQAARPLERSKKRRSLMVTAKERMLL